MNRQGQYQQPKRRPDGSDNDPSERPSVSPYFPSPKKKPGLWESFQAGFKNKDLKFEQWADLRLTPEEWIQKYQHLGYTWRDYQRWKRSIPQKKLNWFQRLLHPSKRR